MDQQMPTNPATAVRQSPAPEALSAPQPDRYKRYSVTLLGRFMRQTKHEYPCKLHEISVGVASIMSPVVVEVGERIIAYFDHIGGIEGKVAKVFDGGFEIEIIATQHKRQKLAAQITWLINRDDLPGVEARRHQRFVVSDKPSAIKLSDGTEVECRVQDVSISGASIAIEPRPPVGTKIMLGRLNSVVVRHHETGVGVQFVDIQDPEALRKYFS